MGFETLQLPAGWVDVAGRTVGEYEDKLRKQIVRTGLKELTRIRICRLPTVILGGRYETNSPAGHYWVEIINDLTKMDGSEEFIESYGWYPGESATLVNNFTTEGFLNADCKYFRKLDENNNKGIPDEAGRAIITEEDKIYSLYPFDPHHNKRYTIPNSEKGEVNHPYLFANDSRTEEDVIEQIRNFATTYKKKSNGIWTFSFDSFEDNTCHTFLFNLLYETNIADKYILEDPHFKKYINSADRFSKENEYVTRVDGNIHEVIFPKTVIIKATEIHNKMKKVEDNAQKLKEILN